MNIQEKYSNLNELFYEPKYSSLLIFDIDYISIDNIVVTYIENTNSCLIHKYKCPGIFSIINLNYAIRKFKDKELNIFILEGLMSELIVNQIKDKYSILSLRKKGPFDIICIKSKLK